jgi:RNA recognition motif-containing protein
VLTYIQAEQAIDEGRRLYVGNMPYQATTKDVEKLFEDVLAGVQAINIAVDPMTGRNPSYCFVDFKTKEMAEQVMEEYDGRDFQRRPLKVKPGIRSGTLTRRGKKNPDHSIPSAIFER